MGKLESSQIIIGILYATGAISLLVVSYLLFIKRFKRNKLEAVSEVTFTTSKYDIYEAKTQFLIEVSEDMEVSLELLDSEENHVDTINHSTMLQGENVVDFDPTPYQDGNYYLSLKSANASILRKININKNP